jgi:hypothetical protein
MSLVVPQSPISPTDRNSFLTKVVEKYAELKRNNENRRNWSDFLKHNKEWYYYNTYKLTPNEGGDIPDKKSRSRLRSAINFDQIDTLKMVFNVCQETSTCANKTRKQNVLNNVIKTMNSMVGEVNYVSLATIADVKHVSTGNTNGDHPGWAFDVLLSENWNRFLPVTNPDMKEEYSYPKDWLSDVKYPNQWNKTFKQKFQRDIQEILQGVQSKGDNSCAKADHFHQQFVQMALRPYSPVKHLLVMHRTGAGKTRSMVNVINNFYYDYHSIVILVTKDDLRGQFYKELLVDTENEIRKYAESSGLTAPTLIGNAENLTTTSVYDSKNKTKELDKFNQLFGEFKQCPETERGDFFHKLNNLKDPVDNDDDDVHMAIAPSGPSGPISVFTYDEMNQYLTTKSLLDNVKNDRKVNESDVIDGSSNFIDQHGVFSFDKCLVICDEVQYLLGDTKYEAIVNRLIQAEDKHLAMFSATPFRQDKFPEDTGKLAKLFEITKHKGQVAQLGNFISHFDGGSLFMVNNYTKPILATSEYFDGILNNKHNTSDSKLNVLMKDTTVFPPYFMMRKEDNSTALANMHGLDSIPQEWSAETQRHLDDKNMSILDLTLDHSNIFFPKGFELLKIINIDHTKEKSVKKPRIVVFGRARMIFYIRKLLIHNKISHYSFQNPDSKYIDENGQSTHTALPTFYTKTKQQKNTPQEVKDLFNEYDNSKTDTNILLYDMTAKPEGSNLFKVDLVVFLEMHDQVEYMQQAVGRANRMCKPRHKDGQLDFVFILTNDEMKKYQKMQLQWQNTVSSDIFVRKEALDNFEGDDIPQDATFKFTGSPNFKEFKGKYGNFCDPQILGSCSKPK